MTEEIAQNISPATAGKPQKRKETPGEMIRSLVIAVLIALVFRSLAYEPFHIPSGSMLTTLYEGDYIFVNKFTYGYSRYSFPFSPNLFHEQRVLRSEPQRGDVVVFRWPAHPSIDYIKRIVGMPGDKIQVRDGLLYINGKAVEVTRRDDAMLPDSTGQLHSIQRFDETLPNGKTHTILNIRDGNFDATGFDSDNTGVYTVPPGHYFMMGDNRDNSEDSRYPQGGVGYVPEENIVGRAEFVLFSIDWSHERFGPRMDRFFKKII